MALLVIHSGLLDDVMEYLEDRSAGCGHIWDAISDIQAKPEVPVTVQYELRYRVTSGGVTPERWLTMFIFEEEARARRALAKEQEERRTDVAFRIEKRTCFMEVIAE